MGIDGVLDRPPPAVAELDQRADSRRIRAHLLSFAASLRRHEHEPVPARSGGQKRSSLGARGDQHGARLGIGIDDAGRWSGQLAVVFEDDRAIGWIDDRNAVVRGADEFEIAIAVEVGDVERRGIGVLGATHESLAR